VRRTDASASISRPQVFDLKQVIPKFAADRLEPGKEALRGNLKVIHVVE
jgi:hypothetical protein